MAELYVHPAGAHFPDGAELHTTDMATWLSNNFLPLFDDITQEEPTTRNSKRQSQSCDACRARKLRCSRRGQPITEDSGPEESCRHCTVLEVPCTFNYKPKKRGPPNQYLRRLKEAQGAAVDGEALRAISPPPRRSKPRRIMPLKQPTPPAVGGHSSLSTAADVSVHEPRRPAVPVESVPQLNELSVFANPVGSLASALDGFFAGHQLAPLYPLAAQPFSAEPITDGISTVMDTVSFLNVLPLLPPAPTFPPLQHLYRPHSIDTIAPRQQIEMIMGLFFDVVYPLRPCIHKPSFLADFASHREETDAIFFALIMSTVASTLVQLPRSYLPMQRAEVRQLAQACYEASRHVLVGSYNLPTSTHVVIRYLDTVYQFCLGLDAASHASFGEAQQLALTLHMHEETSYDGLDPIESEIRRRTFWLLFNADKGLALLLGRPVCLRDEDCTLLLPKEIDDECITIEGITLQPTGKPAVVSGLNYITRIMTLLGEILVRIRADEKNPPQGPFLSARLDEVKSLHQRILSVLAHAPQALRLKVKNVEHGAVAALDQQLGPAAVAGTSSTARLAVESQFDTMTMFGETVDTWQTTNPFLVMQGGIYVAQQLVRFVIEQYRDKLLSELQSNKGLDTKELEAASVHDRETVAGDLLKVLHSIPMQSIATNGPSLVHRVRFVASTLLETVRNSQDQPLDAARAHAYLWDFLSILSQIERNYLLEDDMQMSPGLLTTT
ncbi:fungal-specific transcription factor domain-containing protein [Auriculariales sp. MPI-PUGE-AT-0066]|nr:fungal-specific transcription factor domain-containing protein [Auriculariales sp. MPI-PUGE-AT-0066]